MSKLADLLNRAHASADGDERLRLLDEGLAQALAWNETGYIALFAKLAGQTCEQLGSFARAIDYFALIPRHVGNDAWTHLSLGKLHLALGEREQALACFKTCREVALRKKGQKQAIKFLEQELRRNHLTLADLG